MKTTTSWKTYETNRRIRASYGLTKFEGQAPYFSITADTQLKKRNNRWYEDGGGCMHEEITKAFPRLAPLVKWHLFSVGEGPMHYIANSIYHLQQGKREFFNSSAVFGALPDDEQTFPGEGDLATVKAWLEGRLPALLATFEREMAEFGVSLPGASS